jgi:hypothetical protein
MPELVGPYPNRFPIFIGMAEVVKGLIEQASHKIQGWNMEHCV